MKIFNYLFLSLFFIAWSQAGAKNLLSEECLLDIDKKIGNILIEIDGRFDKDNKPSAGIDITTVKELPSVRHPLERRLKFRVFETTGGIEMKEYRVRFTLSYTDGGICFLHGIDFMLLTPYEQSDSGIKYHNDHLYPPKKK
jgi:hypothetical protein